MNIKALRKLSLSLFIFDLDGTALGGYEPYEQFPPEFAEFLDHLNSNGIKWATATTWDTASQLKLIRASGVKSNPVLLTGSSGRTAFSVIGDKLFPITGYMEEIAILDYDLKRKYGKAIENVINKLKNDKLVESISYNDCGHHVITFTAADGKEEKLWQVLQTLIDKGIYYSFNPRNLKNNSLLPKYMNKGRAVKIIQKLTKVSPSETLVAGDETNDIHMFDSKLAKYMVCPQNAHMDIKKMVIANNGIVALNNYSYGIIEAINKLLSKELIAKKSLCVQV
jgi:hydroxymethylpyrimidine pyrophosphatase-like HAD family hydrolase